MSSSARILIIILATATGVSAQVVERFPSGSPGVPRVPADGSCAISVSTPPNVRSAPRFCSSGIVSPPAGWYSGDTHEHSQLCFSPFVQPEEELRNELIAHGENVASVLVWGVRITPAEYLASFYPLITGTQHPSTAGYPQLAIQYGIETSGFQCARLGHTIALGVGPGQANYFVVGGCPGGDGSGDFAAPVVDLFQQNPATVVGYAHQTWPVPLYSPAGMGGFDWEEPTLPAWVGADSRCSSGKDMAFPDPTTTIFHPILAPFDLATGRLNFLETVDMYVDLSTTAAFQDRWFGLYYKVLNAGQQVSIAGGTDADCVLVRHTECEPRTWVKLPPGRGFDYAAWTEGLAQGRTSVSDGGYQFLELQVAGSDPGERLYYSSGGGTVQVPVVARFHVAPGTRLSDTIEIIQDGAVVYSRPTGQLNGSSFEVSVQIPFTKSGWLAARTGSGGAHTGAVYVHVDLKPIANCAEADYLTIYADYLTWLFDWAASLPDPSILQAWLGCSEPEIRAHIAEGRKVFAAVRDYASGTPKNVTRLGWSTPSDRGPMGINIDDEPQAGTLRTVNCFNAPPNAVGALLLSAYFNGQTPSVVLGAHLFVLGLAEGAPYFAFPSRSSKGGFGEHSLPLPPTLEGYDLYAQWVWYNPPAYASMSPFSSSDVLQLKVR